MTLSLPEGSGNSIYFRESAHALRLDEAFGGARLTLTVDVSSTIEAHNIALQMTAELVAGSSPSTNLTYVCEMTADRLVTPYKTSTTVGFTGAVSSDALNALEHERAGGPLYLLLRNMRAMMVGTTEHRLMESASGGVLVTVPASAWAEQYERVVASTSFSLLVSAGNYKDIGEAARHLNQAREQLCRGTVDSGTATEIRLALETVRKAYETTKNIKAVRAAEPMLRSAQERWAVAVEDTISLVSGYIHSGEETLKDAVFTRPLAESLIHMAAGMLGRLAAERHAGLV